MAGGAAVIDTEPLKEQDPSNKLQQGVAELSAHEIDLNTASFPLRGGAAEQQEQEKERREGEHHPQLALAQATLPDTPEMKAVLDLVSNGERDQVADAVERAIARQVRQLDKSAFEGQLRDAEQSQITSQSGAEQASHVGKNADTETALPKSSRELVVEKMIDEVEWLLTASTLELTPEMRKVLERIERELKNLLPRKDRMLFPRRAAGGSAGAEGTMSMDTESMNTESINTGPMYGPATQQPDSYELFPQSSTDQNKAA